MKTWKTALFLVVVTLLPFALAEGILRLTRYHLQFPYIDDPATGYSLRPHYHGPSPELYGIPRKTDLRVNSLGFRGHEISSEKPKNVTRILLLGDSCTFGLGLEEKDTFAFLTEKMLNDEAPGNRRYEVVNMGVAGYTSYQGLQSLQSKGLALQPDLIVAYFGWNDHWISEKGVPDREYFTQMHEFLVKRIRQVENNPLRHLRLYAWLTDQILRLQDSTRHKSLKPNPEKVFFRVPVALYGENLKEIVNLGQEKHIPVILITAPDGFEKGKIPVNYLVEHLMKRDDSLIDLHESYVNETHQAATQSQANLLDIAGFFKETDRDKLMEPDGIHPNTAGHRIIAHELVKVIRTTLRTKT